MELHKNLIRETSKWKKPETLTIGKQFKGKPLSEVPTWHIRYLLKWDNLYTWLAVGLLWELEDRGEEIDWNDWNIRLGLANDFV